jgi:acetoin:2,6-dichlorophenolindophenol oxidoreductase subunit beta
MADAALMRAPERSKSYARMSYMDAIVDAQIEEMERDSSVILMGENIAIYGGGKLVERFDETRVWDMPISETGFTGAAIGAAMTGLRPIVDLTIASFMYLASDPIINQASKIRYMTGGQVRVPIVFRCCMYYAAGLAAQHSDRPYPMFLNVPGLKILCPSTPADVKGMLKSAVRDDDPVILFEDTKLWPVKDEVPIDADYLVPIGKAAVKREGSDVTIVAVGSAVRHALDAAEALVSKGIAAEVIDPRTLKPLDMPTILQSVAKTGRLVIVEHAHRTANLGADIAANVCEVAFGSLKAPLRRVCVPDVHIPFSPSLEDGLYPNKANIIAAVQELV